MSAGARHVAITQPEHVETFNRAIRELAAELGVEVHESRGRPASGSMSVPELTVELARRELKREDAPDLSARELAGVWSHMGTCSRCGHAALELDESGRCPRCSK